MLFEEWILLQCISFIHAHKKDWRLSSYRTDTGVEVNAILDTGEKILALECKLGRNVSESQTRGLRSFEDVADKPVTKYVLYLGDTRQKFSEGMIAVPYQDFLLNILPTV